MNKIKFDNTEFEVLNYSKTTYFNNESINSNGSCSILTDNIGTVNELAENPIDTIQIYHDDELIYNLQNANAHIDNTNEYFNGERMDISINLTFDIE